MGLFPVDAFLSGDSQFYEGDVRGHRDIYVDVPGNRVAGFVERLIGAHVHVVCDEHRRAVRRGGGVSHDALL